MNTLQKPYVRPTIETIDSSEILQLIGPVQGYGGGGVVGREVRIYGIGDR